jgi:hypothetical protein
MDAQRIYDAAHYQELASDCFALLKFETDVDEWIAWAERTAEAYRSARALMGLREDECNEQE